MRTILRLGPQQWLLVGFAGFALAGLATGGCSNANDDPGPLGGSKEPGAALAAQLAADTGKEWVVDVDAQLGTPDLLEPKEDPRPLLGAGTTPEAAALAFLEKYQSSFGTSQMRQELRLVEAEVDEAGLTHVRFEQVVGGLPVLGEGLTVHFTKSGAIAFVNGRFVPNLASLSKVAARSPDSARRDALVSHPGATSKDVLLGIDAAFGARPGLAYVVRVEGKLGGRPVIADVFVDATTGKILGQDDQVRTERASGRGVRSYAPLFAADTKTFEVDPLGPRGTYALKWPSSKSSSVVEVISQTSLATITSTNLADWDPLPMTVEGNGAAVDAYVHTHLVDAFYRSSFRWRSYDNKGSNLRVFVHDNDEGDANAYWNGSELHFGDGNAQAKGGTELAPTDLDTVAHEVTHAVTGATSRLVYGGESGALNESASDVFACIMEQSLHPNPQRNLWFSEDALVAGTPYRNLRHPHESAQPQPSHVDVQVHKGLAPTLRDPYQNDLGGVHINSGIPNNAFALMVEGGVHDTSRVVVPTGGWELGKRVAWFAQRYNDRANTQFYPHARWQIAAARKVGVAIEPVACSWVAVGVITAEYLKKNYNVACEIGCKPGPCSSAVADAGSNVDLDASARADFGPGDSCVGRPDGIYCSQITDYSAIECKSGGFVAGHHCPSGQKCVGPNGPGTTTLQCK